MSKVLEKIINIRLISYLESHNLLSPNQFGFRKNLSTDLAVHTLVDHIVRDLDRNLKCLTVFLDLAKAFDTVSIPILTHKLESLGIRGTQLSLFQSYLSGRSQSVRIDCHDSSERPIEYGVPQGSILGPSLFLVYINDLCSLKLDGGIVLSYADDTVLVFSSETWSDTYRLAQRGLHEVSDWLTCNLLTLNVSKTKFIEFSIRKSIFLDDHSQRLSVKVPTNGPVQEYCFLEKVTSVKYLGVVLDSNLTFKEHIIHLSSRVRKLIYIFRELRYSADNHIMKMVYQALCQSIIGYCISTWGGAAKTHIIQIERAQRAVLKVCCFKPRLYPTSKLYEYCQVPSVRQLFIKAIIIKQHPLMLLPETVTRRDNFVSLMPQIRTSFCRRFFNFLGPYLYKKIHKELSIIHLNKHKCSTVVSEWLLKLTYTDTEDLLKILD